MADTEASLMAEAPPELPKSEKDYKAREAYRSAYKSVIEKFLNGELKDEKGEPINHREKALAHADIEGRKAIQNLKKTGVKMSVYVDHP